MKKFERKRPITTTFDDAVYETDVLNGFEPDERAYRFLYTQPKAETGGYRLKSGLYTMNAKSFCLRGYSYGPSRGDGHLYAPLKGKKADFIKTIIKRYGDKPKTPQQDVQVILWAIIAGADMEMLGKQYSNTLHELFTPEELLQFQAKEWFEGVANKQIDELKQSALIKLTPRLQNIIDAENKIRSMVQQNQSFQEIEKIAIITGVAPKEDYIREVPKGTWSYHPNGFFVRFFPNGYPRTRIDVYVPFEGEVVTDKKGRALALKSNQTKEKEVVFDPSGVIAMPANRGGQAIGQTSVPETPCVAPNEDESVNYSVSPEVVAIAQPTDYTCWATVTTMMYLWKEGKTTGNTDDIERILAKISVDKLQKYLEGLKDPTNSIGGLLSFQQESFFIDEVGLKQYTKCVDNSILNFWWCRKPVPSIQELQELLCSHGPLAFQYPNNIGSHIVIIYAVHGNGNPNTTLISIIDPINAEKKTVTYENFYNAVNINWTENVDSDKYNIYYW